MYGMICIYLHTDGEKELVYLLSVTKLQLFGLNALHHIWLKPNTVFEQNLLLPGEKTTSYHCNTPRLLQVSWLRQPQLTGSDSNLRFTKLN